MALKLGIAIKPKRPRDFNQLAKLIVDIATGEAPPDPNLTKRQVAGSKSGEKGGKARAGALTPAKRKKIAKKASLARWAKKT